MGNLLNQTQGIKFCMDIISSILTTAKRMISEYHLCTECFGRQFSLLGTGLSNTDRANSILNTLLLELNKQLNESQGNEENFTQILEQIKEIAIHTDYKPAKLVSQKYDSKWQDPSEFSCYLCNNLFADIDSLVNKIIEKAKLYEFSNYLVGTSVKAKILDKEDEFRARLSINSGESLKRNINRVTGKKLEEFWKKSVEFNAPELNIQIILERNQFRINLLSNPVCIKGRYRKFMRGIPQTHWPHKNCRGKGCEECNFTGKQYPTSVEELINPLFVLNSKSEKSVFHGAGREDIDARCIGTGRPFIIELKEPKVRTFDLPQIQNSLKSTDGDKVEIFDLEFVPRSEIKKLKTSGENTSKTYDALIVSEVKLSKRDFKKKLDSIKEIVTAKPLQQRTPIRVVHRRADLTRKRSIFNIDFQWVNKYHFRAKIKAMGGTYIKEFISGDEGRTKPSLAELFGVPLKCEELDIIDVGKL